MKPADGLDIMLKDKVQRLHRTLIPHLSSLILVASIALTGCDAAQKKSAVDVAREDFYSSMGTKEGEGSVKFLDARTDSAYAPYEDARLFELVAQVGELTAELRGVEPAFIMDSVEMERLSKNTAHMAAEEKDNYMKRQQAYAAQKEKVDSLRAMFDERTTEVANIINKERGFCGYKVTATVNDEAGREEKLVFLTDKAAEKVLLKMREADFEEVKNRMKAGMAK